MAVKLVLEPRVYVVGRQKVDADELGRFLVDCGSRGWTTDTDVSAEVLVEVAGRNCYTSYKRPCRGWNKTYIKHILEAGHGSVIEHASWSFIITGVSRSLTHELVRHRHMSYSQRSQRYVDESEVAFVVPPALMSEVTSANALSDSLKMGGCDRLTDTERVGLGWIASAERDLDEYIALVEYLSSGDRFPGITDRTERRKAAREAARSVLPNSTETSIFVTANARALRNFLELRGSRHADAEMARLSVRLLGILQAESPNIFGEYRLVDIGDGRQEITTDYRKV